MHKHTSMHTLLGAALLLATLASCGDDKNTSDTTASGGSTTAASTDAGSTGSTSENPTTTTPTTTDPTVTGGSTGGGQGGWAFADDPYDAYTQIDRHGAVEAGTAGIAAAKGLGLNGEDLSIRDMYNASNPAEDAANMWLGEIANSIMFFHGALDDDLMGLGLVPATFDETVAQAGPVIIPDTIKYDPSKPTGYPNGRALTDPVVDITLAAVLLKLDANQPLTTFADLPLNPPMNDVPFGTEFPYLAPPHPAP